MNGQMTDGVIMDGRMIDRGTVYRRIIDGRMKNTETTDRGMTD